MIVLMVISDSEQVVCPLNNGRLPNKTHIGSKQVVFTVNKDLLPNKTESTGSE